MKFHRVDGARDRSFWSVRVSRGLRMIVHKTTSNFLLCYVGEHDESYRWAGRRSIERHPNTGAAQLVEIREVVRDVEVPRYVTAAPAASPLFSEVADNQLLASGAAADGKAQLPRPGACVGLGRYRQDHRGAAPRGLPGPDAPGCACAPDHVLHGTRGCAARSADEAVAHEPKIAERLEVGSMGDIGRRLYRTHFGRPELTTDDHVRELLRRAASEVEEEHKFSLHFLFTEWSRVVDAWQLASWEEYRDVPRLARKTRLSERQRALL